jgi:hypothetical protein
MDMIGHQAIRQDLDLESLAPLCHELDVMLLAMSSHHQNHVRLPIIGLVFPDFRNSVPDFGRTTNRTLLPSPGMRAPERGARLAPAFV